MKAFITTQAQPSPRRSFWHHSGITPVAQLTIFLDFQLYRWVSKER